MNKASYVHSIMNGFKVRNQSLNFSRFSRKLVFLSTPIGSDKRSSRLKLWTTSHLVIVANRCKPHLAIQN